jgi:hypothetical protein
LVIELLGEKCHGGRFHLRVDDIFLFLLAGEVDTLLLGLAVDKRLGEFVRRSGPIEL